MTEHYATRLHQAIRRTQTPALVGLDPRPDRLPADVLARARRGTGANRHAVLAAACEEFCCRIIDVIAPLVPAIKPQAAFFEECGPAGLAALANVIRHGREAGVIVIADAKRGDIGSTAEAYARAWLAGADPDAAPFAADALTVNPWLGPDTLAPFIEQASRNGAGLYVLVKTSNPQAGAFQDVSGPPPGVDNETAQPVYHHVAREVERLAAESAAAANAAADAADNGGYGSIGAVVGATWPEQLTELRNLMPHAPLLIPGYGSQGGNSTDVAGGFDQQGLGALVNSSRGINYAWQRDPWDTEFGEDRWEQAVDAATRAMIADLATHTPAKALREAD